MSENQKPKILIICDYYLPGYKSGGGMRTIVNMVERMSDRFDFWIITRDHDGKLDKQQYKTVKINVWNEVRGAKVYYLSRDMVKISKLRELIINVKPKLLYFNSYFATLAIYVMILRRLKLIPKINVVIAPCGELSEGALNLKSSKKKVFRINAKVSGLYQNIIWKASSEIEKKEIEMAIGMGGKIFIAPDLPPKTILADFQPQMKPGKNVGEAKMIFLSRFMRKKNFKWLLENLSEVQGNLTIDIYGPLEDELYWKECLPIIEKLSTNIKVESKGASPHELVLGTLIKYHFFILPTLGENFGHVFLEALACGCPLIISDQTPWLELEKCGIGWDLSLENPEGWLQTINQCIGMDDNSYSKISRSARDFVVRWFEDPEIETNTLTVVNYGLDNRSI